MSRRVLSIEPVLTPFDPQFIRTRFGFWESTISLAAPGLDNWQALAGGSRLVVYVDETSPQGIVEEQSKAISHFVLNCRSLACDVSDAIFSASRSERLVESTSKSFPLGIARIPHLTLPRTVTAPQQLADCIRLSAVHVQSVFYDGIACVGLEFEYSSLDELGVGVLTHAGKVLHVGHADVAVLNWISKRYFESNASSHG